MLHVQLRTAGFGEVNFFLAVSDDAELRP